MAVNVTPPSVEIKSAGVTQDQASVINFSVGATATVSNGEATVIVSAPSLGLINATHLGFNLP